MNLFLDTVGQKNIKLLKILLSEERYFSVKELTTLMDMTTKTIKKLNLLLISDIQNGSYQVEVSSQPRLGVRLSNASAFFLAEMEQFYIEKSMCYQIINQLFHGEFKSAIDFSTTNFTSISSFYKSLKEVRVILESFNMGATVSFPAKLEGQEKQCRSFLFHFYWQAFKGMKWPFKEYERALAEASLAEIEKKLDISYSIPEKEMLYYWLAIIFQRLKTGTVFQKNELFFDHSTPYLKLKNIIESWFLEFEEDYLSEESLENEVQFLYMVLCGLPNYDTGISNKLSENLLIHLDGVDMQEWICFFTEELNKTFLAPMSTSEIKSIVTQLSIAHLSWNQFSTGKYKIQEPRPQNRYASKKILETIYQKGQLKKLISVTFFCDDEKKEYYEFLILQLLELKKNENLVVTIYLTTNLEEKKEKQKRIEIKRFLGSSIQFTQRISGQTDIVLTDSNYMSIKKDRRKYQISSVPYEEKEFIQLVNLVERIKESKIDIKVS